MAQERKLIKKRREEEQEKGEKRWRRSGGREERNAEGKRARAIFNENKNDLLYLTQ